MRTFFGNLVLVAAAVSGVAAHAVVRPGWERPILQARITPIDDSIKYPVAEHLTLNKQDGAAKPTSFKMVEDTGLRCITTPCPSHVTTTWRITDVESAGGGSVLYKAVENLFPRPNVRLMPPRRLQVIDHTRNITERVFTHLWEVKIEGRGTERSYVGKPAPVYTPAGR